MKSGIFKYLIAALIILCLFPSPSRGEEKRDSVVISLITCWPGSEVYELCGHEALRVRGIMGGLPVDSVWNYGVFDFNEPNFIYRFVKGETDYMLAGYPFAWFLPEYQSTGRRVLEQDLNLTDEESLRLVKMLQREGRPENRTYRYNYVRDNCATRIIDRIDSAAAAPVIYPDKVKYGTFRNEMRAYHKNYPWYQFGIDLALGSGIDIPLKGKEEMFVPLEMAEKAGQAHFPDGRSLVKESRVLNQGMVDATLAPTSFWFTPLVVAWGLFVIVGVLTVWMVCRRKLFRWLICLWFAVCGLTGCVVTFLVFLSQHEATDPNVLILWLNPLQLILAVTVWSRKMRWASYAMAYYNLIVVGCLLIVWAFQRQSANPAFFPLMGITLLLAAAIAIIGFNNSNKSVAFAFNKKTNSLTSGRGRSKSGYKNRASRKK